MAHRTVCGRVAEVVADSNHQKVFRESPDMLSGGKKRQGHHRRTVAEEAILWRGYQTFEQTLYISYCTLRILFMQYAQVKIQRCVLSYRNNAIKM